MTCGEAAQLIYRYCRRSPDDPEARLLAAHIASCPPCRRFLAKMDERFARGDDRVEWSEIPPELMDVLARLIRETAPP